MKTSPEGVRALAESWASIDGKMERFLLCEADPALEEIEGRFGGYMADAESMVERLAKRGFYIAPIPATVEPGVVERALEAYEAIVFTAHASRRKREAMRAALEAAGLLPSTPAWRAIDSAPRDGTPVLLSWPALMHDQDGELTDQPADGAPFVGVGYCLGPNHGFEEPEALNAVGSYFDDDWSYGEPTHWMPLPSSPVSGGEEE